MKTGQDFNSGQGLAPKGRFEKDCGRGWGALRTYLQALSRDRAVIGCPASTPMTSVLFLLFYR